MLSILTACAGLPEPAVGYTCPRFEDAVFPGDGQPWVPVPQSGAECQFETHEGSPVPGTWQFESDSVICDIARFNPDDDLLPGAYDVRCQDEERTVVVGESPSPAGTSGYVVINWESAIAFPRRENWGSVTLVDYDDLTDAGGFLEVHTQDRYMFMSDGFFLVDLPDGRAPNLEVTVVPVGPDGERWQAEVYRLEHEEL